MKTKKVVLDLISWIRDWFVQSGAQTVVIGMSGGKDSTITAALLVEALGSDHVFGVLMPQGDQGLNDADKICDHLGIRYTTVNIGDTCSTLEDSINVVELSSLSKLNIPARIRMTTLYALGQNIKGGVVVNTCNLSENWLGYATKFGDAVGDFSPLGGLTVTEVLEIGDYMGLPYEWVHKTPDDGLPGSMSDEEKLGFSYAELDRFIRKQSVPDGKTMLEMWKWHESSCHKREPMPEFIPKKNDLK